MLNIMTIEDYPNTPILTQPAVTVDFPLSEEDQRFITELKKKVIELGGVGLAAPQVGVHKQIIAFVIDEKAKSLRNDAKEVVPLTVLINPRYEPVENALRSADWEACFSVKNTYAKLPRYNKIRYTAQTETGEALSGIAEGFTARVLQHEIDHIHGILILNHVTKDYPYGPPADMIPLRMKDLSSEQRKIFDQLMAEKQAKSNKE